MVKIFKNGLSIVNLNDLDDASN